MQDKEQGVLSSQAGALVKLHKSGIELAEQCLKDKNMKLGKARKRKCKIVDHDAYYEGIEDSKNIDVKRRKIQDGRANVEMGCQRGADHYQG